MSVPTRLAVAARSTARTPPGVFRCATARLTRRFASERLDHAVGVGGLREDDHAIARLEDVVAVRKDRRSVADDRADERAANRHVLESLADVLARVAERDVDHLIA